MYWLKRIIFWLFVLVSIGVAIWGYLRLKEAKAPRIAVTEHLPGNAACLIETKNSKQLISQLTRQNLIWNSLLTQESIQVAQNGIQYLDSLVTSKPEVAEVLDGNSLYWCFVKNETRMEHLIAFKVKETSEKDLFTDFFAASFSKDPGISSFDAFFFTNNAQKWILCYKDGIIYMSSDLFVLQSAIELKKSESIASNVRYQELVKLNGEQETLVYLDHSQLAILPHTLFARQSLFSADVELNAISLTGYTENDSSSLFHSLRKQEYGRFSGMGQLPGKALTIQGLMLSDPATFYQSVGSILGQSSIEEREYAWRLLNDSAMYNLQKEAYDNMEKEVLTAQYSLNDTLCEIMSIRVNDMDKASALLSFMSDSVESGVYKLNANLSHVFKCSSNEWPFEFARISENTLLLFSNKNILNYYTWCQVNDQLLAKDENFRIYTKENLSLECNYFYFENSELLKAHNVNSFVNSEILWSAENPISQISLTAKVIDEHVQVRIHARHAPITNADDKPNQRFLWSFKTDSIINTNAFIFKNHLTNENEICLQDEGGQFYLISSTGNLLWKKRISEAVQSDVFTVDIFKNGKFQLLFNTQNYLHLIDRNGNYVQGFPVKLPAKATSNLTLLDYDGKKDYRLFLACADHRIYNFSLYGVKTEGFIPLKTDAEVNASIHYVKVGASDYLVTFDKNGKIYAFSRKGEGRIDFKNKISGRVENILVIPGNNLDHTKLVFMDAEKRQLIKISLSDQKETAAMKDDLKINYTTFTLWSDDGQPDLVVSGNGAIGVYDLFAGKLFAYQNDVAEYGHAQIITMSGQKYLIALDKAAGQIQVLSSSGKLVNTFTGTNRTPLISELYRNGKQYVLLINHNSISCSELTGI